MGLQLVYMQLEVGTQCGPGMGHSAGLTGLYGGSKVSHFLRIQIKRLIESLSGSV